MRKAILALATASLLATACTAAPPPATGIPSSAVLDAHEGTASATLRLAVRPRRHVLSQVAAYDGSSIRHVRLALLRSNGSSYDAVLDGQGAAVTLDLPADAMTSHVTLSHLARNTDYRIEATAYKQLDSDPASVISLPAGSRSDFSVLVDDQVAGLVDMPITLVDRDVTAAYGGPAAAVPGTQADPAAQDGPAIAYDEADNRYLVAWRDTRLDPAHGQIYAQFLAADGSALGAPFAITDGSQDASAPHVAWDSRQFGDGPSPDRFLVTWQAVVGSSGNDLQGRFVQPDGTMPGGRLTLAGTGDAVDRTNASLAFIPGEGRYFLAWEHQDALVAGQAIHAVALDADTGLPSTAEATVAGTVGQVYAHPAVARADRFFPGALVAWRDPGTSTTEVHVQRYYLGSSSLLSQGSRGVVTDSGNLDEPQLVYNEFDQELMLALTSDQAGGPDLYLRRFSSSTTSISWAGPLTPLFTTSDHTYVQGQPQVVANSYVDELLFTWRDASPNGTICAARTTGQGALLGSKSEVQPNNGAPLGVPVIGYASNAGANSALVLWADGSGTQDVFFRQIDSRIAP